THEMKSSCREGTAGPNPGNPRAGRATQQGRRGQGVARPHPTRLPPAVSLAWLPGKEAIPLLRQGAVISQEQGQGATNRWRGQPQPMRPTRNATEGLGANAKKSPHTERIRSGRSPGGPSLLLGRIASAVSGAEPILECHDRAAGDAAVQIGDGEGLLARRDQ